MKKIFSNKRLTIAIIAVALVIFFTIFEWGRTLFWHKEIIDLCNLDNSCQELGSLASLYELPFKKIILFSSIIFTSAFLLLFVLRNKE